MSDSLSKVFILPGWQNSSEQHWQTRWEKLYGYERVQQHEWMRPLRGDWIARLEEVVISRSVPSVLVAHSLGCQLVAAWAAHSKNTHLVKAAMLVAPPDTARADTPAELFSWRQPAMHRLPFKALMLASQDDPFGSFERAKTFADIWGADFIDYGKCGHINTESNLGDWAEGHKLLQKLME